MSDPFVTQKIASEIFALREFLLVEHGHIGWVHTLKVWHEQMLDELRVRAAPREPSHRTLAAEALIRGLSETLSTWAAAEVIDRDEVAEIARTVADAVRRVEGA